MSRKWWENVNDQIPPGTLRLVSLLYTNVVLGLITVAGGLGLQISTGTQVVVWALGAAISTVGVWRAEVNRPRESTGA